MRGFFRRLFGPPKIKAPTLGILNLSGEAARELVSADRSALKPLFKTIVDSPSSAPKCAVLLIYCALDERGAVAGSPLGLRELIRDSGAKVVVVASPNPANGYIAATKERRYGRANLVMTLDRKGEVFPRFFSRLFGEMFRGVSMPVAWVRLAPQSPRADQSECPSALFICELGQLAFE